MATDTIARIMTSFAGRIGVATNDQFKVAMTRRIIVPLTASTAVGLLQISFTCRFKQSSII